MKNVKSPTWLEPSSHHLLPFSPEHGYPEVWGRKALVRKLRGIAIHLLLISTEVSSFIQHGCPRGLRTILYLSISLICGIKFRVGFSKPGRPQISRILVCLSHYLSIYNFNISYICLKTDFFFSSWSSSLSCNHWYKQRSVSN